MILQISAMMQKRIIKKAVKNIVLTATNIYHLWDNRVVAGVTDEN